ncbi:MAG: FAD-dependent oxidoreductase [Chlorobium limicola]|uniref:FAD-dependent oxidoreductase n=1 Tax=Chlorobium limicola TaxID=1092 RepID=UPI0023F20FD0|nr:FAD-dependent oxidoreductase [Chlorobium limicola]NTV21879.1 FAD-dependent oxidoreductase [Chlorobium limicola]
MERREFIRTVLSRTGIAAGVSAAALAGAVGYYQPRKELYNGGSSNGDGAERLAREKNAVVVGGGLAGISSAIELARRGFRVTLVEASPSLGGKLTGWNLDALGERFPVEHGFHGFFDQYYNLNEMFAYAGVKSSVFDPAPGYPVLFRQRSAEVYGKTPKWFPFNILSVVGQSRSLDIVSFLKDYPGLLPVIGMFRYDYQNTFRDYDSIDFMTYCRRGDILPAFIDTVLHPFADATMNRMEVLSAAEAIRYFHFYFMGSPEGLAFRITNCDCMTALIDPLESKLKELGVTILKGRRAVKLIAANGTVSGVELQGGAGSDVFRQTGQTSVPESGWALLQTDTGVPVIASREGGVLRAFDARCTHMGCPVTWDAEAGGFYCPCHAGRFDTAGNPVGGPPEAPLAQLDVAEEGGVLVFRTSHAASGVSGEVLPADYCVVASDVGGTRELVLGSGSGMATLESSVASLGEADPYAVYRLWLDSPLGSAAFPFYTVSGYTYTDSISIYSDFQEPFISWAKKKGGCVVELHAYAIAPEDVKSEEVVRSAMKEELHHMFPETRKATILHELFMQQSNFTRWAPGDHSRRPGVETPLSNLFFAGDWVRVDAPVFLMEAAVFTGRMAANAIFSRESLQLMPLPIVPMDGIFA